MRSINPSFPALVAISLIASGTAVAAKKKTTPADGYTIHVLAPHQMESGQVGGPFHHYCKPVQQGKIFQCLLFESDDPNANLVGVEYFVDKALARKHVPLIQWNRHFHDHEVEIATGRVQVLDVSPEEAKTIAQKAAGTDGIIFELWQEGAAIPDGKVTYPTSVGHVFRTE
jgi:hypothetical protein